MGLFALSSIIPIRLTIARTQAPAPEAILVLEGHSDRVKFAAQFSKSYPNLPIWLSGNPNGFSFNQQFFQKAGVSEQQIHYDFCATDTVTNSTCNANSLAVQKIQHIYIITSDYHMALSLAIAAIVLGSRGILATPVPVASEQPVPESFFRTARDCLRSVLWVFTGRTGASLRYVMLVKQDKLSKLTLKFVLLIS